MDCRSLSWWVLPEIVLLYLLLVPRGGFDATHGSSGLEGLLGWGWQWGGRAGRGIAAVAELAGLRQVTKSEPPPTPA